MKPISFFKMEASGNDFIVIDNRNRNIQNTKAFAAKVCALHTGVGADGILLFERSRKADFKMRIVNSDGSEAEACGNGFRCIALYAREKHKYPAKFTFESISGLIQAEIKGRRVKVQLAKPSNFKEKAELTVAGHRMHYSFINTGVPHAVIFVEGLSNIDVENLGRAIRNHGAFKPKGTNVNFVEVKDPHQIHVRTYERGVEKETLACGTGSTAAAVVSGLLGYATSPVKVKTSGGEILTIEFNKERSKISRATLEGEVHWVYEGQLLI